MKNLRTIRKALGFSQKDVAEELDISIANYSKIERGEIQLTVERLLKISIFFQLSPDELLYHPRKSATERTPDKKHFNITFIPVSAQAGLFGNFSDENSLQKIIHFFLPIFYEKDLFMVSLEGDSMYPTFSNGDYILIKENKNNCDLKWGEPYLVLSDNGQVVKRIQKTDNELKIVLKSDNDLYPPYDIDVAHIRSLWEVKGVLSKNLAPKRL